jgi:hypothetical protein
MHAVQSYDPENIELNHGLPTVANAGPDYATVF